MFERIQNVAKKELTTYFSSPAALIFLIAFLAINLFIFFSLELFFARNIADTRPLFEWIPLLMIFLASSLTMKMWSEERRAGTLEFLQTLPVSAAELVIGKFFACLLLVTIALLLTIPIPITVAFMGDLDWGPVIAGYIATIFLSGAYIAIGLYVSSKTDNQIVALIVSALVCVLFFIIGARPITNLFGTEGAGLLYLLGTGSRFESITRGVVDIRDLYYYLSIIGVFLSLNIYSFEQVRWFKPTKSNKSHKAFTLAITLLCANLVAANLWLHQLTGLRVDLTENSIYSISETTEQYLDQLQEPLLIRGYFSAKTHPLLAPLAIRLKDLLAEYEVAGRGNIIVEIVDPRENPDLEEEAAQRYGIKPVPFQISDKYEAKLVNSYFDIVLQYGDKYETLSFQDLIEVKAVSEENWDVTLRNPEYDITRSIKKILYEFQSVDSLFEQLPEPVQFVGYISGNEVLPKHLVDFRAQMDGVLKDMSTQANGKLLVTIADPQANGGAVAQEITEAYGFTPMLDAREMKPYYFYMTLQKGSTVVQIPVPNENPESNLRKYIEAGLKRFSPGFLKTVAIMTPPTPPRNPLMPQMGPQGPQFVGLEQKIMESYQIRRTQLADGTVPGEADILVVVAPKNLTETQVFAIDQFLMKGGTVVFATGTQSITRSQNDLTGERIESGLEAWLKHNGIEVGKSTVLDLQSGAYPIPVQRGLILDLQLLDYPMFVDIRADGMPVENSPTSGIPQLNMAWSSPVTVSSKLDGRTAKYILKSSEDSWTTTSENVKPNLERYGQLGFPQGEEMRSYNLGAIVEGSFKSFFAGKQAPMLNQPEPKEGEEAKQEDKKEVFAGVIEKSPESARIIIYGSNEFLEDQTLRLATIKQTADQLTPVQLIENSIDWSLADRGLLSIRARSTNSRLLESSDPQTQFFWEIGNYLAALLLAILTFSIFNRLTKAHLDKLLRELKGEYA